MYAPTIEKMAKDYRGKLKVVRVDVDQCTETAKSHGIQVIPTTFLYHHGKVVKTWRGVVSPQDLKLEVNKTLKPVKKTKPPQP
jgi:thioredoxin 1